MAEYSCNWDSYKEGKLVAQTRGAACYASLYFGRAHIDELRSYFWTVDNDAARKNAEWFKTHFIMKRLHPRVKDTFEIVPVPKLVERDLGVPDEECDFDKGIPGPWWTGVKFDLTKINSFDLFVMLNLFRYPQENPEFVVAMRKIKRERKCSLDEAFVVAHGWHSNWGHSLQNAKIRYDLQKKWSHYNFLQQWLAVPNDTVGTTVPFAKGVRKPGSVSSFFTGNPVMDDSGEEEPEDKDDIDE